MNHKLEQYVNLPLCDRLKSELAKLPKPLNDYFADKPVENWRMINAADVVDLQKVLKIDLHNLCLMLLPFAAAYAETPISQFNVGAIVVDEHGDLYFGANFEFANTNMAQTVHAEQSAISHAWMSGAGALKLLVVNYPPCGHCRQFINETKHAHDFQIQLPDRQAQSFAYYLPEAFGPDDLNVPYRILGDTDTSKTVINDKQIVGDNELATHAYDALLLSHSPYSHSESGIALKYEDGEIVKGSYGENAAFNPSLPPLQVALNYRRLLGKNWRDGITEACLIERKADLSQLDNTKNLLQTLTDCQLQYLSFVE